MATPEPFFDLDDVRVLARKWAIDCGTRIATRRTELGWNRATLATLVGTTEATIHRIESGAVSPRDYLKMAIAAALAVPVEQLWPYPSAQTVFTNAAVA